MLGDRIVSMHVHDNHGTKDEHLWPGDGTIDWPAVREALQAAEERRRPRCWRLRTAWVMRQARFRSGFRRASSG